MILAATLTVGAFAGLALCWLHARHEDREPETTLPPLTVEDMLSFGEQAKWPNDGRACRRAANQ